MEANQEEAMTWGKIDDKLHSHPKVDRLSDKDEERLAALGLWTLILSHGCDYLLDGVIERGAALRFCGGNAKLLERLSWCLVEAGFWHCREGGGWEFHDWSRYQPTRASVEAERTRRAEAGRVGGRASGQARAKQETKHVLPEPFDDRCFGLPENPRGDGTPDPDPDPVPKEKQQTLVAMAEPSATGGGDVQAVFDAWATARRALHPRGKRPVLDAKRRTLIKSRLKDFSVEDLKLAVTGIFQSPHHIGENDRHTEYTDIKLALRDAGQIEKFRALAEGKHRTDRNDVPPPPRPIEEPNVTPEEREAMRQRALEAMRRIDEVVEGMAS